MVLITIFLKYGITCDHLEPKVESLTWIFDFGHLWPKSGQFRPTWKSDVKNFPSSGSRCLRKVCDQAQLSTMYGSRDMGTPITGNYQLPVI